MQSENIYHTARERTLICQTTDARDYDGNLYFMQKVLSNTVTTAVVFDIRHMC